MKRPWGSILHYEGRQKFMAYLSSLLRTKAGLFVFGLQTGITDSESG